MARRPPGAPGTRFETLCFTVSRVAIRSFPKIRALVRALTYLNG